MAMTSRGKVLSLWKADEAAQGNRLPAEGDVKQSQVVAGPRYFPFASTSPRLPASIPDEILDYYGWVFCQGGFQNLKMTFEGFLSVIAAVSPSSLRRPFDIDDSALATE
jgi:hypothetical protein